MIAMAEAALAALRARGWRVATAESCTGGLIAAALTEVAGSSDVVLGGIVAYANAVKVALLGVRPQTLADHGAVSGEVAAEMAAGARIRLAADVAVAVTGVAGPGGGSADKPVGLVWFGLATADGVQTERHVFPGDRAAVRHATVLRALTLLSAPPWPQPGRDPPSAAGS